MEVNGKFPAIGNMLRHEGEFSCPVHGKWKGYWFFSKDTDEPVGDPVCPKCRDEEESRIRVENAQAVMEQMIEETLLEIGVPENSKSLRLENYVASTDSMKAKAETIKKFVYEKYPSTLVLYGTAGSGKTHLAVSALSMVIMDALRENRSEGDIKYIKAAELLRDFKSAMNAKRGGKTENQIIRQYEYCKMLVIDEFGRFIAGDYNVSIMQEILTYRIENDLKTIIIKNGDMNSVLELLGEHNVSRLKAAGRSISFDEPDWRATHRRTNNDG